MDIFFVPLAFPSTDSTKKNEGTYIAYKKDYQVSYKGLYDDNIKTLSSPYYYYLSRLYIKKIGTNEDDLFE